MVSDSQQREEVALAHNAELLRLLAERDEARAGPRGPDKAAEDLLGEQLRN